MTLSFFVPGVPHAKGSKQMLGKAMVEAGTRDRKDKTTGARISGTRKLKKAWFDALEREATEAVLASVKRPWEEYPVSGRVHVQATFYLPIPKSRLKGKKKIDPLEEHTQKPDLDKLQRGLGDALVASKVMHDDGQISRWLDPVKLWCLPGNEGVSVTVSW